MKRLVAVCFLLLALLLGWMGLGVVRLVGVLANPQALTQVFPWPWVRDRFVLPKAQEQVQNLAAHLPPQDPALWVARALAQADEATWRAMADALLPPEKMDDLWAATWPSLWKALRQPGAGSQEIALTPWKQQLTQGVGPALEALWDALPLCSPQENMAMAQTVLTERWDEAPLCRPPRQVLETFGPTLIQEAQRTLQRSLPDTLPIHRWLPAEALATLRRVFLLAPLVGWGLVLMGGLLALWGVALAAEDLAGWLAWAGSGLLVYGIGVFVMAKWGLPLVMRLGTRQAWLPTGSSSWLGSFWRAMWEPVAPWMWGLLGVGIVLWGGGLLLRAGARVEKA